MTTFTIYTEEAPTTDVVGYILEKVGMNSVVPFQIIPKIENNVFEFEYKIEEFPNINIILMQGKTSCVDYLISKTIDGHETFLYAIEETKTDETESRNTTTNQRIVKFLIVRHYFPDIGCIMLYNKEQREGILINKCLLGFQPHLL